MFSDLLGSIALFLLGWTWQAHLPRQAHKQAAVPAMRTTSAPTCRRSRASWSRRHRLARSASTNGKFSSRISSRSQKPGAVADKEMIASFGSEDFKEGVAHFVESAPRCFPVDDARISHASLAALQDRVCHGVAGRIGLAMPSGTIKSYRPALIQPTSEWPSGSQIEKVPFSRLRVA
jgi:hypothetical protein